MQEMPTTLNTTNTSTTTLTSQDAVHCIECQTSPARLTTIENTSTTPTCSGICCDNAANVAAIVVVSLFILIALVGNSLVLLVFNWRWRSTGATKVYVLMLAALDLLCTVLGTPRELLDAVCVVGCRYQDYRRFTVFATYHLNYTSALVLAAIAVSRLVKVSKQGHAVKAQAKIKVKDQAKVKVAALKCVLAKGFLATNTVRGAKILCVVCVCLSVLPTWPAAVSWSKDNDTNTNKTTNTTSCMETLPKGFYLFHVISFSAITVVLVGIYSVVLHRVWSDERGDCSERFSTKSSARSTDHQQRIFRGFPESDFVSDSGNSRNITEWDRGSDSAIAQKLRTRSENTPKMRSASASANPRYIRSGSDKSNKFRANFDSRKLRCDFVESRSPSTETQDCRSPISSESEDCPTPLTFDTAQMRSLSGDSRKFHADFAHARISIASGSRFSREAARRMSETMSDTVFHGSPELAIKNSKRRSVSGGALDLARLEDGGFQNSRRRSVCRTMSETVTAQDRSEELAGNSKTSFPEETKFSNFPPISYSAELTSSINLTLSVRYGQSDGGLLRQASASSFQFTKHGNRAKQTTLAFLFVTIVYILSYLPYFSVIFMRVYGESKNNYVASVFLRSHLLSNVLNPFIYGFCNPYFRSTVWKIITRRRDVI